MKQCVRVNLGDKRRGMKNLETKNETIKELTLFNSMETMRIWIDSHGSFNTVVGAEPVLRQYEVLKEVERLIRS